jgi:hypothetical protein
MNKITLNKGQFYKLKQYRGDRMYVIICPLKKTTLDVNRYSSYIPTLFKVTGYGKRKKLYAYSFSKYPINTIIDNVNYNTVKPLTIKECMQLNIFLREEKYVFNKKTDKLIKLR